MGSGSKVFRPRQCSGTKGWDVICLHCRQFGSCAAGRTATAANIHGGRSIAQRAQRAAGAVQRQAGIGAAVSCFPRTCKRLKALLSPPNLGLRSKPTARASGTRSPASRHRACPPPAAALGSRAALMGSDGPDESPGTSPAPSGDEPPPPPPPPAPPPQDSAVKPVLSSLAELPPDPFLVAKGDVTGGDGGATADGGADGKDGGRLPHLPWRENPLFTKARRLRPVLACRLRGPITCRRLPRREELLKHSCSHTPHPL